jgi:hypothetical protein
LEELRPPLLQLFRSTLSGEVTAFGGILGEIEDLLWFVVEMVDVLL